MIGHLKHSSLTVLKHAGLTGRVAHSRWRRNRLLVLCYHGVSLSDEHEWNPGLYVSQEHLERRLVLLRQHECTVLPLATAIERLYRRDLPERAVVLTFDDGYYDFQERAWPLLRKYGFPATVYLTTGRVDHNLPNVNLLISYALWAARDTMLDGRGLIGLQEHYSLATDTERTRVLEQIVDAMQTSRSAEETRDHVAMQIVERLGLDYRALLARRILTLMRQEEVAALSRQGVDFQLHTHFHRTPDDASEFAQDVLRNRARIEAMTGVTPRHFCYPSGNYLARYIPALADLGVESATTCDPGIASPASNPLLLPRFIDTAPISEIVFESWVTGIAACLPRRTRRGGFPLPPQPDANHAASGS